MTRPTDPGAPAGRSASVAAATRDQPGVAGSPSGPGLGPQVVVVEDDEGIGPSLENALRAQGYDVRWVTTARAALDEVGPATSLVILDLGLPDGDGLDVCRRLRARALCPQILVLTARSAEADVVLGLDAGADDYLAKPFRLAELLARVRACTRRSDDDRERFVVGDLEVDVDAHRARVGGHDVDLRPKEFRLLVALARNAGRVLSRRWLLDEVWEDEWLDSTKTLDIHIWALRRKLDEPDGTSRIFTVRGVGYRLDER